MQTLTHQELQYGIEIYPGHMDICPDVQSLFSKDLRLLMLIFCDPPKTGNKVQQRTPAGLAQALKSRGRNTHRPKDLPMSFSGVFEVCATVTIFAIWDHNVGDSCDP